MHLQEFKASWALGVWCLGFRVPFEGCFKGSSSKGFFKGDPSSGVFRNSISEGSRRDPSQTVVQGFKSSGWQVFVLYVSAA